MKMFLAIIALAASLIHPEVVIANEVTFIFATAAQARDILTKQNDYVKRMSPFDRAVRMKTDKNVSEETYLKFVGTQVLEWTEDDKATLQTVLTDLRPRIDALASPWPDSIYFIKTTGDEEGNAFYTRENAIVLPRVELAKRTAIGTMGSLHDNLAHEFFHVLSRYNPALKEALYAAIGFQPCGEVAFPSKLAARKITNPDAPKSDHCIRVRIDGKEAWVTSILFSKSDKYDVVKGGGIIRS